MAWDSWTTWAQKLSLFNEHLSDPLKELETPGKGIESTANEESKSGFAESLVMAWVVNNGNHLTTLLILQVLLRVQGPGGPVGI